MQPQRTLNDWIEPELDSISGDRRSRPRYEIELALQYKMPGEEPVVGSGTTRDMNSGGVAFEVREHCSRALKWSWRSMACCPHGSIPLEVW